MDSSHVDKCFWKGCDSPAPYGVRLPGLLSDIPEGKRGSLKACIDHIEAAVARRNKSIGVK